jgi:hypothetical protein
MRRRFSAGAGSGEHRPPAYGGLLLDAGGTLLQVAQPVAETYASIGRRYGSEDTTFLALSVPLSRISSNIWPCGLVVFPDPDVHRSTGVRKPEKSIMEGFKRAFAAPWPKTLRYQVTEGTLKNFEIVDILDSSNWHRIFGTYFIVK